MILRRVARPLLASIFIMGGVNELRQKEAHVETVKPFLDKAADKTLRRKAGESAGESSESLPGDPVTMVQVDAITKIAAGAMLSLGVLPRVASVLLLGSLVPTTLAVHAFWEEKDPEKRQQQLIEFLKHAGLAGGLMLAVADTGGKPSLGWRARHAAEEASHHMQGAAGAVQRRAGMAATKTSMATEKAAAKAAKAAKASSKAGGKAGKATGMVAGVAKGKGKAAKAATLPASAAAMKKAAKSAKDGKRKRARMSMAH